MQCYAAHLGNCRGKISKEHYISESVLEIVGKVVQVSGFPWQDASESKEVGTSSLKSGILCKHHNSQLAILDASGKTFLQALKSSFENAHGDEEFTDEVFFLEGDKVELWLLKVLCGLFAAFRIAEVPQKWVSILFKREPFPEGHGLHIFGQPGSGAWYFNLVRVISVQSKDGRISGAKFGIGGLALLLDFGRPIFSEAGVTSIYRPESIIIEKDAKTKKLNFSWGNYEGLGSVHLHIEGNIKGRDSCYKSIVGPFRNN